MMIDIGIIGAGITGLAMAQLMHKESRVTVFEQGTKGGLIRCERTQSGHLYHLVGGHVFNSKNKDVLAWFWSFFDKDAEFIEAKRNAKIWFKGEYVGYPIENNLAQLPPHTAKQVIKELLEIYRRGQNDNTFAEVVAQHTNFEDFLKSSFGSTLFQAYFGPYNAKIWQMPLSAISLPWLEGKLPMPNIEQVFSHNILHAEEEGMVHASFFYPRTNGSQFIIDKLSEGVNIQETSAVKSIEYHDGKIRLNSEYTCDKLVYTGDIRALPTLVKSQALRQAIAPFAAELAQLRANGTTNVLCETDTTNLSWLYLPEETTLAHRIIYTGNFSTTNNNPESRTSCVVEFSGEVSEAVAFAAIAKLPGNLLPIQRHYKKESYVIQGQHTRELVEAVKIALAPYSIYLLGRFAEWEYYNMDKCMEAAMHLTDLWKK